TRSMCSPATWNEPPSPWNAPPTRSWSTWPDARGPVAAARHPGLPAARVRPATGRVRRRAPGRIVVRLPVRGDADVRVDGPIRAELGRNERRRVEGDVHVQRPWRPVGDAPTRGDGGRGARVPGERPRPSDPVQGLL